MLGSVKQQGSFISAGREGRWGFFWFSVFSASAWALLQNSIGGVVTFCHSHEVALCEVDVL